jgi:hypothetical protein
MQAGAGAAAVLIAAKIKMKPYMMLFITVSFYAWIKCKVPRLRFVFDN